MATYKAVDTEQLETELTAVADAIREKTGGTAKMTLPEMAQEVRKISSVIVSTSMGNPLVLNDSTDLRVQSLRLFGKTTQDSTPTPEAPVELVSAGDGGSIGVTVAGKNLFAEGIVYAAGLRLSMGRLSLGLPQTSLASMGAWGGVGIRASVCPNTTYTVSSDVSPNRYFTVTFYKSMEDVDDSTKAISFKEVANKNICTFTTPANCYCVVITAVSNVAADFTWSWWQLEPGSTATEYESYNGQTLTLSTPNGLPGIPVTTGGNYTDETGQQWVCDEVDFGRGVYVQRIFRTIFKSAVGWSITGTSNGSKRFYTNQFMGVIKNTKDDATKECGLCSHFINVTPADTWYEVTGISINSKGRLDIYYSGIEQTTAALEEYFVSNPVAFMAELATPIETPLSAEEPAAYAALHTNYPNTTILNDGGAGMEVQYVADTKLYIDNQVAALANAMLNQ